MPVRSDRASATVAHNPARPAEHSSLATLAQLPRRRTSQGAFLRLSAPASLETFFATFADGTGQPSQLQQARCRPSVVDLRRQRRRGLHPEEVHKSYDLPRAQRYCRSRELGAPQYFLPIHAPIPCLPALQAMPSRQLANGTLRPINHHVTIRGQSDRGRVPAVPP
jgi:hypothetical protein